jgi:hypothetical protein
MTYYFLAGKFGPAVGPGKRRESNLVKSSLLIGKSRYLVMTLFQLILVCRALRESHFGNGVFRFRSDRLFGTNFVVKAGNQL